MSIATEEEKKAIRKSQSSAPGAKKKKRHHFGWIIVLVVILLILSSPVIFLYGFIYDNSEPPAPVTYDMETSIRQKSVLALDEHRSEPKKINIAFEEGDFQGLISSALESATSSVEYLKGMGVKVEGDKFIFELYVGSLPLDFKSKATITATFVVENEDIVFKITDIKVGKISLGTSLLGQASSLINENDINNAFSNSGLNMKCNLKEGKITYAKEDAKNDITKLLQQNLASDSLYSAILDELLGMDLFYFNTGNNALNSGFNVETVMDNDTYLTPEKNLTLSDMLAGVRDDVSNLINADNSPFYPVTDSHDSFLMEYLIQGYERAKDDVKEYVKDKDFSSLGISDPKTYPGKNYVGTASQVQDILNAKKTDLITGGIKVDETDLDLIFQNTSLLGTSVLVSAPFDEGYRSSYIVIDNFYTNITDGKISFVMTANLGGTEVPLILNFKETASSSDVLLTLAKDEFYIGSHQASSALSESLFELLSASLEEESWIGTDAKNEMIFIKGLTSPLPEVANLKLTLEGESIESNGYMKFVPAVTIPSV